jgi:hypothetical protein
MTKAEKKEWRKLIRECQSIIKKINRIEEKRKKLNMKK